MACSERLRCLTKSRDWTLAVGPLGVSLKDLPAGAMWPAPSSLLSSGHALRLLLSLLAGPGCRTDCRRVGVPRLASRLTSPRRRAPGRGR